MMHDLVPIRVRVCQYVVLECDILTGDGTQHDDQKVKEYGVKLAVDMIRQLQAGGIQGVHFCTLNLEKSVIRVLETLGLAGNVSQATNKLIAVGLSTFTF